MKRKATKSSMILAAPTRKKNDADFLPLEGGSARKLPKGESSENKATVLYIGRIPHGFYEEEMECAIYLSYFFSTNECLNVGLFLAFSFVNNGKISSGFFKQFGTVKRLRIARNRKTGKSKHYGFIEFEYREVAKIVAECMHNYLLFEHMLQVYLIPPERVQPKLWRGVDRGYKSVNFVQISRKQQNKVCLSRRMRNPLKEYRGGIAYEVTNFIKFLKNCAGKNIRGAHEAGSKNFEAGLEAS